MRPQISSLRSMSPRLVAGEPEQVPPVVHELVDAVALHQRRGALVGADEVDERQQREPEQRPRPDLTQRDGGRMDGLGQRRARGDHVRHGEPPGDGASPTTVSAMARSPGSRATPRPGHSGATAPDSHRLPPAIPREGASLMGHRTWRLDNARPTRTSPVVGVGAVATGAQPLNASIAGQKPMVWGVSINQVDTKNKNR